MYRGRLVGAVREAGGICFVEGSPGGGGSAAGPHDSAAVDVVHVADESLAGTPADLVCLSTVVDASVVGESALLLLRSSASGVSRYVLIEVFDANQRLQPTIILSFTVSSDDGASNQTRDTANAAGVDTGTSNRNDPHLGLMCAPFPLARPWIIDGPLVCIPRKESLIVAHLALTNRRGEVSRHLPKIHPSRKHHLTTS